MNIPGLNQSILDTLYNGVSEAVFIIDCDGLIHYGNKIALSWVNDDFLTILKRSLTLSKQDQQKFFAYFDTEKLILYPGFIENADKETIGKMVEVRISDIQTEQETYRVFCIEDLYEKEKDSYFHQAVLEIADIANHSDNLDTFYQRVHSTLKNLLSRKIFTLQFMMRMHNLSGFPIT